MTGVEGRIALVTGAAGEIGKSVAQRLSADGYHLILLDRSEGVREVADELRVSGRLSEPYVVDITDAAAVDACCKDMIAKHTRVDILVNNAGVTLREQGKKPPAFSISTDQWKLMLAINLTGAFLFSRALLPAMTANGWGRIINMSSMGGRIGSRFNGMHYSASKSALIGLTRTIAVEAGKDGVTANVVAPGRIATEANKRAGTDPRAIEAFIPLHRLGTEEEVAATVSFLASEGAGYVTGAVLDVNGGFHMA